MAPKRKKYSVKKEMPVATDCVFCNTKSEPDYKKHRNLQPFLSDRAKIIGKKRSGICSKHQRRLAISIKRARHLGLLPYTPTL